MADGQEPAGRKLRLSKETLRHLEPTPEEAAAVKGGMAGTTDCGGFNTCSTICNCPTLQVVTGVLGATHMTWGCVGRIVFNPLENGGFEISYEQHPNEDTLRRAEMDAGASGMDPGGG